MIARIVRTIALVLVLATAAAAQAPLPIVFVHGNGDSAALWHTTIWRFESQGYDPARLFAVDMAAPTGKAIAVVLNDERLMVRSEAPGSSHLALAEFHH